jgi:hypothetical protein
VYGAGHERACIDAEKRLEESRLALRSNRLVHLCEHVAYIASCACRSIGRREPRLPVLLPIVRALVKEVRSVAHATILTCHLLTIAASHPFAIVIYKLLRGINTVSELYAP